MKSWRGTYSFSAADLFKFIGGGNELKDSSNNRTFRYNDGEGNATTAGDVNTYVLSLMTLQSRVSTLLYLSRARLLFL
jgi:hypothetical protein